jgi:hypothetical protein
MIVWEIQAQYAAARESGDAGVFRFVAIAF